MGRGSDESRKEVLAAGAEVYGDPPKRDESNALHAVLQAARRAVAPHVLVGASATALAAAAAQVVLKTGGAANGGDGASGAAPSALGPPRVPWKERCKVAMAAVRQR